MTENQMFEQIRNYLETAKIVTKEVDGETYEDLEDTCEGWRAIANADELFITDEGQPNWKKHHQGQTIRNECPFWRKRQFRMVNRYLRTDW